ncbi:SMP-30/gluconolactonase/LRE family protein [Cryptosporangium aurantiacum]|uniref:Sugar lactone lactonase YvrE n=1 Tax=Cryptosporangium aurantiacum TaxID=134849 RepID=A0A1M7RM61_9ACTN|nr:SMP-30/gluconolactonase/LRE family protein [Cryptosporangium aurantiacum]SHN47403.1 Sugar lactone lactonase YvrE [Cryptosporangium aurantiacum]
MRADQVTDACAEHGEGPVWDTANGVLRFVDMLVGAVLTFDPVTGELTRHVVADVAAALRPRRPGGWVLATQRGFALLDRGDLDAPEAAEPAWIEAFTDKSIRMNDGGCDPQGRFYCGTMAYSQDPGCGTLYRLDPDRSVHEVLTGLTVSNGLCWSSDGAHAFFVDSPTERIDVFDADPATGTLHDRRPFVQIRDGTPDGLTIDADGGVWVALYGAGAVHRYDRHGALDLVVEVPVSQPTSCAFVDRDLFITTTREGLPDGAEPQAGALFHVRPGVRGLPPFGFGG